jgi:hypothetical protein
MKTYEKAIDNQSDRGFNRSGQIAVAAGTLVDPKSLALPQAIKTWRVLTAISALPDGNTFEVPKRSHWPGCPNTNTTISKKQRHP